MQNTTATDGRRGRPKGLREPEALTARYFVEQMPGKNQAQQMRELVKGTLKSRAANAQEMRIDRHTSHARKR